MDLIPMPQSYERLMEKAYNAYFKHHIEEACTYAEEAFEQNKNEENVLNLFNFYLYVEEYHKACSLGEEHSSLFSLEVNFYSAWLEACIWAEQFIKAEVMLQKMSKMHMGDAELRAQLRYMLDQQKEKTAKRLKMEREAVINKVQTLGHLDLISQMEVIKELKTWPYQESEPWLRSILIQPNVHQMIRAQSIEALVKGKFSGTLNMLWLGRYRDIDISELEIFTESKTYLNLVNVLTQTKIQDPIFKNMIQGELLLDAMMFYPFEKEVITDEEAWLSLYLHQYLGHDISYNVTNSMQDYFKQLIRMR